jgi:hypothetical protein
MALQLPNQHDFQFSSVSVGDIIYRRDANYWANLHAGTAGQVLTAHGAGLAPSWETAGGGDLSTAVILAPNTPNRNTVQPTADNVEGLVILPHSNTQQVLLELGNRPPGITSKRVAHIGVASSTSTVGLLIEMPANGSDAIWVLDSVGTLFEVLPSQNGVSVICQSQDVGDMALLVNGFPSQTAPIFRVANGSNTPMLDVADNKIGFLGATAAIQQATASASGISGIRTDTLANAVADIKVILTALRAPGVTFGLTANTA